MPEFQRQIDFFNKELDESSMNLERQYTQVKWFVQLYMASLFGYFSLSGYLLKESPTLLSYSIGLSAGISVFMLGWLLLAILGHKTAMMILIHKHISTFRGHRLALMNNAKYATNYVFPIKQNKALIASMTGVTPYVFFVINYIILSGSVYVYVHRLSSDLYLASLSSVFISVFAGLFYPRSCVVYNKHIRSAKDAHSLEHKLKIEKCFEDARKEHPWCNQTCRLLLILITIINMSCLLIYAWPIYHMSNYLILLVSFSSALIFAVVRYMMESYKELNFIVCLRPVKHK